jgi:hypothetical protein
MNKTSKEENWLDRILRLARMRGRRQWRKMGFWRKEPYPDWMMYIPNPLPSDEPERKP